MWLELLRRVHSSSEMASFLPTDIVYRLRRGVHLFFPLGSRTTRRKEKTLAGPFYETQYNNGVQMGFSSFLSQTWLTAISFENGA